MTLAPPSGSSSCTVAPKTTLPVDVNLVTSITSLFDRRFSMSLMRPSMKLCCSRAAWYSAFSDKSPCARASAMALMTLGRASLFNCFSSKRRRSAPRRVIGVRFTRIPVKYSNKLLMQILQSIDFDVAEMIQRIAGGTRAGDRRVVSYPPGNRLAANRPGFAHGLLAFRGIHDQGNFVIFYHIDDVRATLPHFIDPPAGDAGRFQNLRGAARGRDIEAASDQHLGEQHRARLVAVAHADEAQPARGQDHARCRLRFRIRLAEGVAGAHDFAGRFHLGTQNGIRLRKLDEGEHRLLHRKVRRDALDGLALACQRLARHDPRRHLGERYAGGFGNEGHRARGARVDLEDVDHAALYRELDVH